jgi:signal transduction histidine kinase
MTDLEQAMHRLLHDFRTPIGVAQGYLRLIREGRLTSEADRERALDQAASSLGRLSRLCDDAADYLNQRARAAGQQSAGAAQPAPGPSGQGEMKP